MAGPTEVQKVRELQRTLYRVAKPDPGRRFHALHDKVVRSDVLERAWSLVRANGGAADIDGQTIQDVERHGVARMLDELAADLRDGRWRPLPARRVFIPKPGRAGEQRPLAIPTVRDRVVQAALKLVIEPVFEADFLSCSFGFRPKRSAHDALQVLIDESWSGRRWVVETDVRVRNPRYRHVTFLARWPTHEKMQHARDRIRELTDRRRLLLPVEQVVREINLFLRGFAEYFRYGNSAIKLAQINRYAAERLALFVGKRHKGGRRHGWRRLVASPSRMGLISLSGTIVAPRPFRAWQGKPNAAR